MTEAGELRPFLRPEGAVYGPVASRRFGRTLGINVFPPGLKVCGFNCVYCQLGWGSDPAGREVPWPSADRLLAEIGSAVAGLDPAGAATVGALVFSGDGEPTLHPEFRKIVCGVAAIRDERWPGRRIIVLSNGTTLDREGVREGLARADVRVLKLDAGTAAVNRPFTPLDLDAYLERLRSLSGVTIQSMFIRGRVDNTRPEDLRAWQDRLRRIRPLEVQVYTLDRRPPLPGLEPLPAGDLQAIARDTHRELGIPVLGV